MTPAASLKPQASSRVPLTRVQAEVLKFIRDYTAARGYAPTLAKIAQARGRSKATIYECVRRLEVLKLVAPREPYRKHQLRLTARAELAAGNVAVTAQCLTCEEFAGPPHLEIGAWSEGADAAGSFVARSITLRCPHCSRVSQVAQKKYV
jgi:SOS-response transcriptional repressor LexA